MFIRAKGDDKKRKRAEKDLSNKVSNLLVTQKKRIVSIVSDNPSDLDDVFWNGEDEFFINSLFVELQKVATLSAELELLDKAISADLAEAHKNILSWAREYSFELVRGINSTTRKLIEDALRDYVTTPGYTLQDFIDLISPSFGVTRAEMIAVTEVTRAYSAGSEIGANLIREAGIELIDVWNTDEDELVCPICGEIDGKERGDGWSENPPAHPRCRCFLTHEIKNKKAVIDFYMKSRVLGVMNDVDGLKKIEENTSNREEI